MTQRRSNVSCFSAWCPAGLIALLVAGAVWAGPGPPPLMPRALPSKDNGPAVDWRHRTDVIAVKFVDDLPLHAVGGVLDDRRTGTLDIARVVEPRISGGTWRAAFDLPPERLAALRDRAQINVVRAIADPRVEFHWFLPRGLNPVEAIAALNALDIVELASPVQHPAPSPSPAPAMLALPTLLPPDFMINQGYLEDAPIGIGALTAWDAHGTRGSGVRIADIEYDFNANHADLPSVTVLTIGVPTPPSSSKNHGTAVLGQIASIDNGWGTTGIAHEAELFFSHSRVDGVINIANAIYTCLDAFEPGDIILLEAQMWGPNSVNFPPDCFGCVPVEWLPATFTAITIATGNGITIVEAGGNGQQNLDDPIYSVGNNGHHPFLPGVDSGAILVGAGHAPSAYGGTGVPRSRMWYSNHGSRFDVQGWGEKIWTTGYGGAYSSMGSNYWYTATFGGTSGASPIVTGASALVQSYRLAKGESPLTTDELRDVLKQTGTPQTDGQYPLTQKIGPMPNVVAIIETLLKSRSCPADIDGNGVVDSADLGLLLTAWGEAGPSATSADINGDGVVDGADLGDLVFAWGDCPR